MPRGPECSKIDHQISAPADPRLVDLADRLLQHTHRQLPLLNSQRESRPKLIAESLQIDSSTNVLRPTEDPKCQSSIEIWPPIPQVSLSAMMVSEMSLADQDRYYPGPRTPARVFMAACCDILRGSEFPPIVLWDSRRMRLVQCTQTRLPGLPSDISAQILAACLRTGSYIRRLTTVSAELDELTSNVFGPALGGSLKTALDHIVATLPLPYPTPSPMELLHAIGQPSALAADVAELIGCDNLDVPAYLHGLPDPASLLERAWAFAHTTRASAKYDSAVWEIVGSVFRPWLNQMNLATGQTASGMRLHCNQTFCDLHFSSLFVAVQSELYIVDFSKLPEFISQAVAEAVVETLNYQVLCQHSADAGPFSPLKWPEYHPQESERTLVRPPRQPFSLSRVNDLADLHLSSHKVTGSTQLPNLVDLSRSFIVNLQKLVANAQRLSTKLLADLKTELVPHLRLLCEIYMLHDGVLLVSGSGEGALEDALTRHKIDASIAHVNRSEIVYTPSQCAQVFVNAQIEKYQAAGAQVLAAQEDVRRAGLDFAASRAAMKRLANLSNKVSRTIEQRWSLFTSASTIVELINAFEPLCFS